MGLKSSSQLSSLLQCNDTLARESKLKRMVDGLMMMAFYLFCLDWIYYVRTTYWIVVGHLFLKYKYYSFISKL